MATFTSNCDGSSNSFQNNGNIRVTYTAGNGSVTITEIEGMRTDGWDSYEDVAQTVKITLGGVEKTINVSRIRFMKNSSYSSWGLTDTTWTGFNGKVDFKLHSIGSTYFSLNEAAYRNNSFSESQVIDAGYSQQYFDLNGSLDGTAQGGISPMGTADVTIGGTKVLEDGTDYYTQHAVGTSYTVNDIKANAGYTYTGNSSYTGTIGNSTTAVVLPFTTNSYSVSYNANGGSSTPTTQTAKYNTSINLAAAILRANSDSNVTITISYNANGGSGAPGNSTGTAVNTTPYTFSKWALGSSTSNTKYSAGDPYTIPAQNSVMYATWTAGTTTRKSNPSIKLSSTKPTRSGYVFKGWSTSSTATSASYSANTAYTFSANTTLYAVWEPSTQGNIYVKQNGAWVLVSTKYLWAYR